MRYPSLQSIAIPRTQQARKCFATLSLQVLRDMNSIAAGPLSPVVLFLGLLPGFEAEGPVGVWMGVCSVGIAYLIRQQIEDTKSEYTKEQLQKRLAKLVGKLPEHVFSCIASFTITMIVFQCRG